MSAIRALYNPHIHKTSLSHARARVKASAANLAEQHVMRCQPRLSWTGDGIQLLHNDRWRGEDGVTQKSTDQKSAPESDSGSAALCFACLGFEAAAFVPRFDFAGAASASVSAASLPASDFLAGCLLPTALAVFCTAVPFAFLPFGASEGSGSAVCSGKALLAAFEVLPAANLPNVLLSRSSAEASFLAGDDSSSSCSASLPGRLRLLLPASYS